MRTRLLLGALVLLVAGAAQAQKPTTTQQVEQLYAEGAALFKAAKYRAAIAKFEAAYKLYPDPILLYNKGRSQEALGEVDAALATYRECATHPKTPANLKAKVLARQGMLEKAKRISKTAPRDPTKPPPGTTPLPREEPSNALTISKWVVGGAGLAALIAGGVVFGMGASDHGKIDDAKGSTPADMTRAEALDLQDSGKSKKNVGYILMGVGGAAVIGSAVLFFLDRGGKERSKTASTKTRLSASASPQGAALLLTGSF